METFRGYRIKGKRGLSHWAALLEEWLLGVERYCRILPGDDAPYIYNERANLSVLTGAAWRAGWIALEEFQHEKRHSGKKAHYGRADLWLHSGSLEEIVEAKFRWIAMASVKTAGLVEETMASAVKDAKASKNNSAVNGIGVGFFPLYKKSTRVQNINKLIEETIEEFSNFDFHAMAWCFPPEMRDYTNENTSNRLPGVILLAKNSNFCD